MIGLLVNVDVSDLERAIRFYTSAFDLRVLRRLASAIVELEGAPSPIYLTAHAADALPFRDAQAPRSFDRHWTPVHLDFVVADLEPAIARAERAGASREGEVRSFAWGRFAVLADPFGNGFCLLQFTGRGYAELESGEA